jgi:ABC-type uncharacterized transport system ATPase subunit
MEIVLKHDDSCSFIVDVIGYVLVAYSSKYHSVHSDPDLLKGTFFSTEKLNDWTEDILKTNNVKTAGSDASITSLSGGNQQKLIIGRELRTNPKLILAVQPTRGVDIGSIEFIYENLLERRQRKAAIFLVSQELEEVLSLSDRVAILFRGRIMGIGKPDDFTKAEIGLMMAGIQGKLQEDKE